MEKRKMKFLRVSLVILWLQLNWVRSQQRAVKQSPASLRVPEGTIASLNCTYEDRTSQYFAWYKQGSRKGPELLMATYSNGDQKEGRFTAHLNRNSQYLSLLITDSQPSDSATYLCAASRQDSNYRLIWGSGTKLIVKPVIHQPDPSVYKLRGPKSSNTSVCLLTDFASQDNVTQEMKHMVFRSGSTALDVKAMDSKSNGALAWSNSINFQCNSTFETYAFYPSSEYSCDAKLVEKSFETDMNLNFQNLSVIALRILLLKVAGFNLLMTLRLWSS